MKKFLKYTLAVIVGSFVTIGILMLAFFIMIGIFAASSQKEISVKDNSVLVIKLDGPIVERKISDPISDAIAEILGEPSPIGLNQILSSIKKAQRDDRIKGIYLESGTVLAGYATVEEIRNALLDFKNSGKFIISYAPVYTQKSYYLVSVADKVYLSPGGMLEFKGISSHRTFFKNTLEKLGIEMQVFRHGEFKSAVEPYTRTDMSEPARMQTLTYTRSIWNHLLSKINDSRGLSVEKLNVIADQVPMFKDETFLMQTGLIDGLKYKDQVINELKDSTNTDYSKDINSIEIKKYADVYVPDDKKGISKNKIAVIYAEGVIDGTDSSEGIISEDLSRTIRQARRDTTIKAVVLRINSPGGSALGSEIIWREVKLTSETKPLIVSMSDLAASGGYYIACAADTIVAHPNTLTGSIGVFGLIPNVKGLFNKIGITTDRVKTNKYADLPSIDRPFTSDEKELLQAFVENSYNTFIDRCAEGRNTSKEKIDEIGQGRVWSGKDAIDINLVDLLGGLDDAIEIAAKNANITDDYRIVELPEELTPFEQFVKSMGGNVKTHIKSLFWANNEYAKILQIINNVENNYPIQARIPYDISLN